MLTFWGHDEKWTKTGKPSFPVFVVFPSFVWGGESSFGWFKGHPRGSQPFFFGGSLKQPRPDESEAGFASTSQKGGLANFHPQAAHTHKHTLPALPFPGDIFGLLGSNMSNNAIHHYIFAHWVFLKVRHPFGLVSFWLASRNLSAQFREPNFMVVSLYPPLSLKEGSLPENSRILGADQIGFQFFSYARNFIVSCVGSRMAL